MLEGFVNMIMENMDLIIILVILLYVVKMTREAVAGTGDSKKKRDIRTMKDRVHSMLALNASSVSYKRLSKVKLRGDADIPMHTVGTTVGGILNFQEYIIAPIKKHWWNPMETARMLMVEGEALTDLHEGELVIEGSSIHPVTERFTWVVPTEDMVDKYGDEEIQEKREAFIKKVFNQLGNFDSNDDVWANTKTAIRGTRASARREQVMTQAPDQREEWKVEREAQQEQKRIQKEEDKSSFDRSEL